MDNSQINEFFDLAAYEQQAQQLLKACETTARQLKENFTKVSGGLGAEALTAYRDGVEKVSKTASTAKAAVSEYSKAIEKHNKILNEQKVTGDQITQALNLEANTIAELTAKNRVLESVRKNLNISDAKYAETQKKLIEAQNKNIEKIKEFQNVEQKRVSGIGKYEEAIRNALQGEGNYRTQLMNLRNTMADLEQEIGRATSEFGAQSPQVLELQKRYDELQKKAGQLTDAQGDMQARIKYLADDYGKFKATLQGLQAAMGIVSVFQGFTALLGIHNENLDKVVKNMTALIAVMKGLQEVQNLLNKDNYFIQMIKNTPALNAAATKIGAAFTKIKTAAKAAGGAIGAFVATLGAVTLAMRALMDDEFYRFNKEMDKLTDSAARYDRAMQFLDETLGGSKITLSDYNSALKDTSKGFKDIINAMVITSIADAQKSKLKELVAISIESASKIAAAQQRLSVINDELGKISKKQLEAAKSGAGAGYGGTGVVTLGVDEAQLQKEKIALEKAIDAINSSVKAKSKEYADIMKISAGNIAEEMTNILKNYDLSLLFDKTDEKIAESTNNITNNVKKIGTQINVLNNSVNSMIEAMNNTFSQENAELLRNYYTEIENLRQKVYDGSISIAEFEEEVDNLNFQFQQNTMEKAVADLKELIQVTGGAPEQLQQLAELQKKLDDLKFENYAKSLKAANKEIKDDTKMTAEEVERSWEEKLSDITDVFGSFADTLASISQSMYDSQMDGLNRLSERQNLNYEQQRNIIENTITAEAEKEKALRKLDTQRIKSQSEIAKQQAEIERRKAKFDIAITTATALATAAGAIADAIKSASSGDPYTIAARVAAAVAAVVAGIASVTAAIAKVGNIPAYAAGGLSPKDAPFRAGEKGYEIGIGQRTGKPYMFANDAVYMTPERVNIMPHDKSVAATTTINNNKNVRLRNEVVVKVVNQSRVEKYFNLN